MRHLQRVKRRNKPVKYEDLIAVFDTFDALIEAEVVENLLFKVLDHLLNVYASDVHAGRLVPASAPRDRCSACRARQFSNMALRDES